MAVAVMVVVVVTVVHVGDVLGVDTHVVDDELLGVFSDRDHGALTRVQQRAAIEAAVVRWVRSSSLGDQLGLEPSAFDAAGLAGWVECWRRAV